MSVTSVNAFSKITPELTALMERQKRSTRRLCSLWTNNAHKIFLMVRWAAAHNNSDGEMPMHAWTSCFYTSSVHFSLPTGGIIYNLLLNSGKRRTPYCREYISKYEESPETRHFMDQQELQILKWVESCSAGVCTPSTSASARGRNGPECTSSLSGSS